MVLTLEVTGGEAGSLGAASRKVFRASGGTIGRLAGNDWLLPDPHVSNRHAVIEFRDGAFFIVDVSRNGVFMNRPDNRLARDTPYRLQSGDLICIEPYDITVSIEAGAQTSAASPRGGFSGVVPGPDADPFALLPPDPPALPPLVDPIPAPPAPLPVAGPGPLPGSEQLDPLVLLGVVQPGGGGAGSAPRVADLPMPSALSEHYQPPPPNRQPPPVPPPAPAPLPASGPIPENWWDSESATAAPPAAAPPLPAPAPAPAPPPRRAAEAFTPPSPVPHAPAPPPAGTPPGTTLDLAAVLEGAGLEGMPVTPELAHTFGRILRVVVSGVMETLQARQRVRSEICKAPHTVFRPADNNPLKFSVNVDDALHNLLVKRNAAYLGPVEAFEQAFADIHDHQLALLQALRVAFTAMLAEFEPERLQKEFDRQGRGALLSVPARMRYWDQYCERLRDLAADADGSFRELFGDEFAAAYESQLQRLRERRRQTP